MKANVRFTSLRPEHFFLLASVALWLIPWHLVDTSHNTRAVILAIVSGGLAALGLRAFGTAGGASKPVAAYLIAGMLALFIVSNAGDTFGDFAPLPGRWVAVGALFIVLCALTVIAAWLPIPQIVAYLMLGAATVVLVIVAINVADNSYTDVATFNRLGTHALINGHNPYAPIYPDVYAGTRFSQLFYGPGVALPNGRLAYGYPYPPIALLMQAPFALFHVYKAAWAVWPALATIALASVMPRGRATYRLLPLLIVFAPFTTAMSFWTWIEPLVLALLVFTAVAGVKRHWSFPWLLGLTLVSKQYFVVCAPLLVLLLPLFREMGLRRCLVRMVAGAAIVTVPFALVDPNAFYRAVVKLQTIQPYRADSLSLVVLLHNHYGWFSTGLLGVLPLVLGGLVAVLLAWKAPRTMEGFVASVGVTLLVTVLFSKQAFGNYYALIDGCFLLAAILLQARTVQNLAAQSKAAPR